MGTVMSAWNVKSVTCERSPAYERHLSEPPRNSPTATTSMATWTSTIVLRDSFRYQLASAGFEELASFDFWDEDVRRFYAATDAGLLGWRLPAAS